jgi:hypothetical protein
MTNSSLFSKPFQNLNVNFMTSDTAIASAVEERLTFVHAPTPPRSTRKYVFARRKPKDRSSKVKLYLYSSDLEDLILAAKPKKIKHKLSFKMSTNSLEVKRKSPFYVGICAESEIKKTFFGYQVYVDHPATFKGRIRICCEAGNECVLLPPLEDPEFTFKEAVTELPPGVLTLSVGRTADQEKSEFETITINRGDETLLSIKQTREEEFEVDCREPFTPFQAFCAICVLTSR